MSVRDEACARPMIRNLELAIAACDVAWSQDRIELCAYRCPRCKKFHTAPWPGSVRVVKP